MKSIKPENVIIVGGASGIGFATAQKILWGGVRSVLLASRSYDKLVKAKLSLQCEDDQKVYFLEFDITDCQSHMDFLLKCKEQMGKIPDGLVVSSGINFDGSNWKGFNISEEAYDKVMDTNLKGVFFLMRNYANYLYENKTPGNICIVSSISAHRDLLSVYQIAKNAISGIVHTYGKYLVEKGIVLNCVEPGTTDTDMMPHLKPYTDGIRPGKPWNDNSIRRVIRPEEIAEIICFLMAEGNEVLSGTCLLAGGGCKSIAR